MHYAVTLSELNSLRYLYAFYRYNKNNAKLNDEMRDLLKDRIISLATVYSDAICRGSHADEMYYEFKDITSEFNLELKQDEERKAEDGTGTRKRTRAKNKVGS